MILAGADLEKGLHFRGKLRPCGTQRLQLRLSRVQSGCAEGHIAGDARQIIIAEVQLRAEALQLEHLRVELLPRRAVAAVTSMPNRSSRRTSGRLLTPRPSTSTRFPCSRAKYSVTVMIYVLLSPAPPGAGVELLPYYIRSG